MARLVVEFDGVRRTLTPQDSLTFGRDASCTVRLGRDDATISRRTGHIQHHEGAWWITNLSTKQPLTVREDSGLSTALPVSKEGFPPSSRAIDQDEVTVVIMGRDRDYELVLRPERAVPRVPVAGSSDPLTTISRDARLTDARREVLVTMARGYLRSGAHYDPNPLTYAQVAVLLGLNRAAVMRRVQAVREMLVESGVPGLRVDDARRPLCEWLLRMRWIGTQDLDWLQPRIDAVRALRAPVDPA